MAPSGTRASLQHHGRRCVSTLTTLPCFPPTPARIRSHLIFPENLVGCFFPPAENETVGVFPTFSTEAGHSLHPLALRYSPQPWWWASAPAFPHLLPFLHLSFWHDAAAGRCFPSLHPCHVPCTPLHPLGCLPVAKQAGLPPSLEKTSHGCPTKCQSLAPASPHHTSPGVYNCHPPPTQGRCRWGAKG